MLAIPDVESTQRNVQQFIVMLPCFTSRTPMHEQIADSNGNLYLNSEADELLQHALEAHELGLMRHKRNHVGTEA